MSEEVKPPRAEQPAAVDQNSLFSGLTGQAKQVIAGGIFVTMAYYIFFAVPASDERRAAAAFLHAQMAIDKVNATNEKVSAEFKSSLDKAIDKLIDRQASLHGDDQKLQKASVDLQKTNVELQKKILSATKEGGMP